VYFAAVTMSTPGAQLKIIWFALYASFLSTWNRIKEKVHLLYPEEPRSVLRVFAGEMHKVIKMEIGAPR